MPLFWYVAAMPAALVMSYRLFVALTILVAVGSQYAVSSQLVFFQPSNFLSYFTNDSNLLAAAVFLVAAIWPAARTDWWRGLAVVCMAITGIVFNLLLRSEELATLPWVNEVVHVIAPVVVVVDWAVMPPAMRISAGAAARWLILPFLWLVYTLARGSISGWYPYPFLNVSKLGAGVVAMYCAAIFGGFLVSVAVVSVVGNRRTSVMT